MVVVRVGMGVVMVVGGVGAFGVVARRVVSLSLSIVVRVVVVKM